MMKRLHDLLSPQQLRLIKNAPLILGTRHPTWFPLFCEMPRAIDNLVHVAVVGIQDQSNGKAWLNDLVPRLVDLGDINGASSALAELRAYGGLLESGFLVKPIPRSDDSTPDFRIDAGDGPITVEVFAKHQDREQDRLLTAIHTPDAPLPPNVERHVQKVGSHSVSTTTAELTPAGKPDPSKPYDSVQANLVSRICAIKQKEHQFVGNEPSLLVIDFAQFGGPYIAQFLEPSQAAPIESGHRGVTCGAVWFSMYGWKGAPLFEEGSHTLIRMGHDGRFRLTGKQKTKLSGVLVVFFDGAVFLENPWAAHRISDQARLSLCRYPWFDLSRSIGDWNVGDALMQIDLHRRMIETLERSHARFDFE
jgi:hypothetical protein